MYRWRCGELVWFEGKLIAWQRGLPGGTAVRRKLCMVPSHSCYIHATWKSKEVVRGGGGGVGLKPSYGWGDKFLWDGLDPSRHHVYSIQPGNCSFVN